VDTTGVEPLTTMSHEINALRNDEVKGQLPRAEVLANAPKKDNKFFRVPKVLE
jgi:aspartyl-tRNA(Asn)/glutamyl-tRNA(Gln) amidotransferase subunit C